jgi:TatA/E family protein of Tat protein translocase
MLSISHLVIIIIAALIFLGPDKIPHFLKSCGEGIVLFKKTIAEGEKKIFQTSSQIKKEKPSKIYKRKIYKEKNLKDSKEKEKEKDNKQTGILPKGKSENKSENNFKPKPLKK